MTALAPDPVEHRSAARTLRGWAELAHAVDRSGEPEWLGALRRSAIERFASTGLPASNDEEWRFTSLAALAAMSFELRAPAPTPTAAMLEPFQVGQGADSPLLAVVNGQVDRGLSRLRNLPAGLTFGSLADAIATGNPLVERHLARHASIERSSFNAVNAALFRDGAFVHIARGTIVPKPLHVILATTNAAAPSIVAPRTLVIVEAGAEATVIESFVPAGPIDGNRPHLTTTCADIVLEKSARLEHIRLQRESAAAYHVGFTAVEQARDSHYRSFTLALGSKLSRHDLQVRLSGTNVETLLYGLYLARGEQLVDNHTAIFHDQPDCRSWEVYKGVLAEHARGVFNGKVIVQPVAQKTDAKQTNRNLLLGDDAKVNTKPQLEIFADDVKCTHGATVGKLDELQRFYLQTRGIAGREAQVLLITAFVAEVLAEIREPHIRESLESLVHAEMDALIG
ncbi:MAG: Fe-S cluster assembly protein SufD [Gemmatimonadales bacterium]